MWECLANNPSLKAFLIIAIPCLCCVIIDLMRLQGKGRVVSLKRNRNFP